MNPNDEAETKPKRHRRKISPKVLVRVTDDLIETALPKDSEHCMVADAVKAAFPTAKNVSVDLATVRFSDPAKGLRYIYLTPRIAQTALVDFDEGRRPHAFQCELTRAAQIVTMYKRKPGEKKSTPVHNLGPKRVQNEGNGRVGTVIGGLSLPVMLEPKPGNLHAEAVEIYQPVADGPLPADTKVHPASRRGRTRRRREFGLRAFKTGEDVLISGTA